MMAGRTMVLILGAVALSATGQLCLKSGARHLAGLGRLEFLRAAARDVHLLSGLVAWAASTVRSARTSPYAWLSGGYSRR